MTKRRSPVCSAVPARNSRTGWSPEMPSAQRSPRRNPCDADRGKLVRAERRKDKSSCACGTNAGARPRACMRSEEHTSELQSLMRISYAVFCLKKKKKHRHTRRDRKRQDKESKAELVSA